MYIIITIIKTTSVGDVLAGWLVILTGWPVTVGVVEVRVADTLRCQPARSRR